MMSESLEIWREVEAKTDKKIIHTTGLLWVMDPKEKHYEAVVAQGGGEELSNADVKTRYPGLSGLPDNVGGFFSHEAGVVKAHEALMAF